MGAMTATDMTDRKRRTNWRENFDLEVQKIGDFVTKKAFYKDFATKHKIAWETVKKHHSTMAVAEVLATNLSATLPAAPPATTAEDHKTEKYPTALEKLKLDARFVTDGTYYVGCYVELRVSRVEPRFIKVITIDGFETEGLLYIAEISSNFVENIEDHFMFGDQFVGEVTKIDSLGRLKVTTKGLFIRNYRKNPPKVRRENPPLDRPLIIDASSQPHETFKNMSLADKLTDAKDQIVKADTGTPKLVVTENPTFRPEAIPTNQAISREIEQVRAFVNAKLGFLSEGSEGMLQQLIDKHGIVNFTMAMAQVLQTFECDLGIYFAKEIDAKLSGRL